MCNGDSEIKMQGNLLFFQIIQTQVNMNMNIKKNKNKFFITFFLRVYSIFLRKFPSFIKKYLLHVLLKNNKYLPVLFPPSHTTTGNIHPKIGFGFKKIKKEDDILKEFQFDELGFLDCNQNLQLIFRGGSLDVDKKKILNIQSILVNFRESGIDLGIDNYYYSSGDYGVLLNFLGLRDAGYYKGQNGDKFIFYIGNELGLDGFWTGKLHYLQDYAAHRGLTVYLVKVQHLSLEPNFQLGSATASLIVAAGFTKKLVVYGLDQFADENLDCFADVINNKQSSISTWLQGSITIYHLSRLVSKYTEIVVNGYAAQFLSDPDVQRFYEKYFYK